MPKTEDIAIQKVAIERDRLVEDYRQQIEAMKRLHAAQGKLRSGQTIEATISSSKGLFRNFRDLSIEKITEAVDDTLVLTSPAADKIRNSLNSMCQELRSVSYATMSETCHLAGKPELCERFMPEIDNERDQIQLEIDLHISSKLVAKRNKGVKDIGRSVLGWLSKVLGSPGS